MYKNNIEVVPVNIVAVKQQIILHILSVCL